MLVDALLNLAGSISGNTVSGANVFGTDNTIVSGAFTGGNVIDLFASSAGQARDMGEGEELFLNVFVTTAFAGGTSAEFRIVAADNAALSSNVAVLGTTGATPVASLTAGTRLSARVNLRLNSKGQRYLGLQVINVGANSAGAVYADIGESVADGRKFYSSGFAVS